ncbi:MAG TPA: zinc metalloprotease HtpX [Bryobacteraceae bacterium]|nr:zinc metalloprotease HtpX [Bryobacteraceae bacterium]
MTTSNTLKTVALLGLLSALLILGGQALAGRNGMYLGLAFAVLMNFGSYFFSEKIALASYNAQPVTPSENAGVYQRVQPIVARLAHRMELPMPKLWLIPEESPNAFATGRNPSHSSIAFTSGILQLMDDRELEGVIAHELGHVLNRDILTSSIAATIAAAITQLSYMAMFFGGRRDEEDRGGGLGALFMLILGPIAATLIQLAISRTREYSADATSAKYTGAPDELIAGLRKLDTWSQRIPMDASPATAHMFIVKPFTGDMMMKLFSTHPSTADRIARLQAMR